MVAMEIPYTILQEGGHWERIYTFLWHSVIGSDKLTWKIINFDLLLEIIVFAYKSELMNWDGLQSMCNESFSSKRSTEIVLLDTMYMDDRETIILLRG